MGAGIVRSHKAAEDVCLLLRRNADPVIADTEERLMCLVIFTNGHLNGATFWTVLDGIADLPRVPRSKNNLCGWAWVRRSARSHSMV